MMRFTDTLVEVYEKYAHERASHSPDEFKVEERSEFLKFLKSEGRETLLEIGCGPGQDAQFFSSTRVQGVGSGQHTNDGATHLRKGDPRASLGLLRSRRNYRTF